MSNKKMTIMIASGVGILVLIGIIFIILLTRDNNQPGKNPGNVQEQANTPIINLSLENSEENQETVYIVIKASMENETPIASIILPNGSEVPGNETRFEVQENGEYTFKAKAETGEISEATIDVSNIRQASASNPYIPEGFKALKDTAVESGFVIEDSFGNQFVWVPVENGQLTRETILDSKYEESASTATALVNSVAKNYGFYMGRYEASKYVLNGEVVAATMPAKDPWTNITFQEASNYASSFAESYEYEEVNTAIINSYAWDTVLKWIDSSVENYSSSVNYGNYSGTVFPTGATTTDMFYNICDMAGNVREWTTEIYKDAAITNNKNNKNPEKIVARVVRGGGASLSRTPKSHHGYPEDTSEAYWGFRVILYK